jgi:hypothetical protein
VESLTYYAKIERIWSTTTWMIIRALAAIGVTLIYLVIIMSMLTNLESERVKVHILERTLKAQEIRINNVMALINETKNDSEIQVRDLNLRFKNENQNMKFQINSLMSAFKDTYKFMLSNRVNAS